MIPAANQELVDSHCHIDLYRDPLSVVQYVETRHVHTIAVTNAPTFFEHTFNLLSRCKYARPAVGFHPELVPARAKELDLMWPALEMTRFVGEIGLDFSVEDATSRQMQMRIFSQILERSSRYGNKVLTLHSRRASSDVLTLIGAGYPGKVILHWFTGGQRDMQVAIDRGFYFSVNQSMVISKTGQNLIRAIPKDRLLTESDGPLVKVHGTPAEPKDVVGSLEIVARIWKTSLAAVAQTVLANYEAVLRDVKTCALGAESKKDHRAQAESDRHDG